MQFFFFKIQLMFGVPASKDEVKDDMALICEPIDFESQRLYKIWTQCLKINIDEDDFKQKSILMSHCIVLKCVIKHWSGYWHTGSKQKIEYKDDLSTNSDTTF